MKLKKILALLLAASTLTATMAACTGDETETDAKENNPKETTATETNGAGETEFDRTSISDNLPNVTFDGKEFRILATQGSDVQYIFQENLKGDGVNDAIHKRNEDVETRFDVKITTHVDGTMESQDVMLQYAQADLDEYDVADMIQYCSWVPMMYNLLLDWTNIPNIDLTKPWWNKQSNDEETINGKIFRLTGDLSLTSLQFCWVLAFNMDLMENWGYPAEDIYQLVYDGEWTIDKMIEMTSEIYLDSDGDNLRSTGDTYGHSQWTMTGTDPWVTAIDARMLTKGEDGNLTITLGTEKVYSTLEKLINYYYATDGCFGYTDNAMAPSFASGKIGILSSVLRSCVTDFAKLNFDYGILPYPKYDSAQAGYLTGAMDQLSVYSVPTTTPENRYDFIGIMMEALNAESYKTVYPAYFDGALKGRYSTDENMANMMDIIVEGRMFDLAFLYGQYIARLPYQFRYCIRDGAPDLASKLAENENTMEEALEDLMYFFETGEQIWY